jgi:hypothetical protein
LAAGDDVRFEVGQKRKGGDKKECEPLALFPCTASFAINPFFRFRKGERRKKVVDLFWRMQGFPRNCRAYLSLSHISFAFRKQKKQEERRRLGAKGSRRGLTLPLLFGRRQSLKRRTATKPRAALSQKKKRGELFFF